MLIIPPIELDDTTFDSNVAEPDAGETVWSLDGSYTTSTKTFTQMDFNGSIYIGKNNNNYTQIYTLSEDLVTETLIKSGGDSFGGVCFDDDGVSFWATNLVTDTFAKYLLSTGAKISSDFSMPAAGNYAPILIVEGQLLICIYGTAYTYSKLGVAGATFAIETMEDVFDVAYNGVNYYMTGVSVDNELSGAYTHEYDLDFSLISKKIRGLSVFYGVTFKEEKLYSCLSNGRFRQISISPLNVFLYYVGDEVINITNHNKYACAVGTDTDPTIGVNSEPPSWVLIGKSNKYALLDNFIGTYTEHTSPLILNIDSVDFEAMAAFGIEADSVTIEFDDSPTYNQTIDLTNKRKFPLFNIQADTTLGVTVTFTKSSGNIKIGEFVIGNQQDLGDVEWGGGFDLKDYSKRTTNDFGTISITEGRYSKLVNYPLIINTTELEDKYNIVVDNRSNACVYSADNNGDSFMVYGIYETFKVVSSSPVKSKASLTVQELT